MTDDISARLRAALTPTTDDHVRAGALVDEILTRSRASAHRAAPEDGTVTPPIPAGARSDDTAPRRRSWLAPLTAAACAAALAVGVALPSILRGRDEAPPSVAGLARMDGTRFIDTQAWLTDNFPTVSWTNTDFVRPPLVAVRTPPWCRTCGGQEVLSRVVASAKARPDARFVVLVPGATVSDVGAAASTVPANVHVLPAAEGARLPGEDAATVGVTPVATRLSPMGALTAVARGNQAVEELLTPPPPTQVLTVTCTDTGTQVDAPTVAAASDGVHLRVVNAGRRPVAAGMPDADDSDGWPWTDPGRSRDLVVPAAPGRHRIICGDKSAAATVEVTDPTSSWRGTIAQAAPTCRGNAIADYAGGPGSGATPREAVLAWPSREFGPGVTPLAEEPGVTVRPLAAGYVDADRQWWLVERGGRAATVLRVFAVPRTPTEHAAAATVYRAVPFRPCGL